MLICFALKEEAAPFRKIAAGRPGISILLTGIGRQNAERALRNFLGGVPAAGAAVDPSSTARANDEAPFATRGSACAPQLVLTCGFAGGLNPELKPGDVVFEIPSRSRRGEEAQNQMKGQPVPPDIGCYERLVAVGARPARFFCAGRIATTAVEKKKLRYETGADAVEMESEAIHSVCREHGIPCVTVRVVSDAAGEDLPLDFNNLAKPDLNLDYGKLIAAIAKAPGKIPALLRLQRQTRTAAERLAAVLAKVIAE